MTKQNARCAALGSGAILRVQTPLRRVKTAGQERILRRQACKQSRDATTARQVLFQRARGTMLPVIAQTAFATRSTRIPRSQFAAIATQASIQISKQAKRCVVFVTRASKCQESLADGSATTAPLAK